MPPLPPATVAAAAPPPPPPVASPAKPKSSRVMSLFPEPPSRYSDGGNITTTDNPMQKTTAFPRVATVGRADHYKEHEATNKAGTDHLIYKKIGLFPTEMVHKPKPRKVPKKSFIKKQASPDESKD